MMKLMKNDNAEMARKIEWK